MSRPSGRFRGPVHAPICHGVPRQDNSMRESPRPTRRYLVIMLRLAHDTVWYHIIAALAQGARVTAHHPACCPDHHPVEILRNYFIIVALSSKLSSMHTNPRRTSLEGMECKIFASNGYPDLLFRLNALLPTEILI